MTAYDFLLFPSTKGSILHSLLFILLSSNSSAAWRSFQTARFPSHCLATAVVMWLEFSTEEQLTRCPAGRAETCLRRASGLSFQPGHPLSCQGHLVGLPHLLHQNLARAGPNPRAWDEPEDARTVDTLKPTLQRASSPPKLLFKGSQSSLSGVESASLEGDTQAGHPSLKPCSCETRIHVGSLSRAVSVSGEAPAHGHVCGVHRPAPGWWFRAGSVEADSPSSEPDPATPQQRPLRAPCLCMALFSSPYFSRLLDD